MSEQEENNPRADNDMAWKQILSLFLKDFMKFFWIDAYEDIDWTKPYEQFEQELMAIGVVTKELGKRYIDKLFKVYLKTGKEQWILLHFEVQHSKDDNFSERMFTYFYRIFDQYNRDVASMAILADADPHWRPAEYRKKIWKSEIIRTYEAVKLTDFKVKKEELWDHNNPFALVVLIQLAAMETKADDEQRLLTKLEFFRSLHNHGWPIEKSMNMYRFLDTILSLNPRFKVSYIEKAKKIDEEFNMNMQFTTIAEQHGFEQGIQHGEAHLLIAQLQAKFKILSPEYIEKINSADANTLNQWGVNFVNAQLLDDVFKQ